MCARAREHSAEMIGHVRFCHIQRHDKCVSIVQFKLYDVYDNDNGATATLLNEMNNLLSFIAFVKRNMRRAFYFCRLFNFIMIFLMYGYLVSWFLGGYSILFSTKVLRCRYDRDGIPNYYYY